MGGDTSPEQQYSLRWNDFHSSILSSFRHLRDAEDFVDVTLACDGCSFTAHKVVLSACSPYFRSLLKANPCQHPIVILRDVQQKDMESLLRFMYNGEVHIGQEHLTDFLKTAQMLQVRGLADVQRLTPSDHNKISPTSPSTVLPWPPDRVSLAPHDPDHLRSPPSKRPRSQEDRPESPLGNSQTPPAQRQNGDAHLHQQESLLGQALEGGPTIITKEKVERSDSSILAQSAGEDSMAASDSDTAVTSDGGGGGGGGTPGGGREERRLGGEHEPPITPKTEPADYPPHMDDPHHHFGSNGGLLDPSRGGFTGALLGIPGLGGLMPGPSGMHNSPDSFGKFNYLICMFSFFQKILLEIEKIVRV
ncbi:unnamed protein product [Acanthoscelides obtectus]|uniref:BTB domain-containing protein n=1 Tax=Acanthoscelides obtectus TaxID=200917 RepID=A0A9P0P0D6_ACAOB|nr:unnamed protein product [Acanthoscelides obtectus]CAK1648986.1 Protein abrupt [Acanthoscelides obtectus]